jgi:hypothetical protein
VWLEWLSWYCGLKWAFCATPDNRWIWSIGGIIRREKPKCSEEDLLQCCSIHHKSHMDYPGGQAMLRYWQQTAWVIAPTVVICIGNFGHNIHRRYSRCIRKGSWVIWSCALGGLQNSEFSMVFYVVQVFMPVSFFCIDVFFVLLVGFCENMYVCMKWHWRKSASVYQSSYPRILYTVTDMWGQCGDWYRLFILSLLT